ncbi:dipeptidase PepV [Kosmotoga sp. DU53]|uniref:dipeptidase PepV n=1 Tax=Kosmotoga sp. DU53 TaxID=1310160 RepID=UPI0007C4DD09|nr:dipeptidase PepV [Kosmotoga sp. DU53]MDK2954156.1 succinyl-diaminopimelate desuccinylase [Kosmotoga sp.]OAA21794.1 dipeptidase [Kosmotoga sp. DU53]
MNTKIDEIVLELRDKIVESVSELLKIPSVEGTPKPDAPFGEDVKKALDYALKLSESLGFNVKNVDNYAGHAEFGNSGKLFGVLGHLDVVPEGDGWSVDPYGGIVKDGYIWGRGAIDDKGPTIAALYALKAVKDSGIPVKNRIRVIFGTDEESGWKGIDYYLKKEETPEMSVTPDASFPIIHAEKGIVNYHFIGEVGEWKGNLRIEEIDGGNASNMVPASAYVVLSGVLDEVEKLLKEFKPKNDTKINWKKEGTKLRINFEGVSAHGAEPQNGVNAIAPMLDLLSKINLNNESFERFIKLLNEKIGYEIDGYSLGISGMDGITGPLTVNLGTLKVNGDALEAVINIRYPVFFNEERIFSQVKEAMKGLTVERKHHHDPLYMSPDSDLVRLLKEVYEEVTGEEAKLLTTGGGTYARAVPNAVAFGALFPGREFTGHKPDERVLIDDLIMLARIYAQLFYRVLTEW